MSDVAERETAKGAPVDRTRRIIFRDFKGMVTQSYRTALDELAFYRLENLQPVGHGNLRCVNAPSAALFDYMADTIYSSQSVNIGSEFLINFATNGKVLAFNVAASTSARIDGGLMLSGNSSRVSQWKNTQALVIDSTGYYHWDGTTFALITGNSAPTTGTEIAVFAGRVWIVSGRTITYSAPDSFTDFSAANGGGSFSLTDPTVRSAVTRLFATNEYLYIFTNTSINVISDVRVPSGATPPTPVFSNTNITSIVGATEPLSVTSFGRSVLFANRYGFFELNGVNPRRISKDIDQTIDQIDFTQSVSAGTAVLNNILCACFLFKWNDPETNLSRQVIGTFFDDKWFLSIQVGSNTQVVTAIYQNTPTLFTFSGNKVYRCFDNSTNPINTKAETALWDGGDSTVDKQVLRIGNELAVGASADGFTLQADNQSPVTTPTPSIVAEVLVAPVGQSSQSTVGMPSVQITPITFLNNSGNPVQFLNNMGNPVSFFLGQFASFYAGISRWGKYVGITFAGTSGGFVLSTLYLEFQMRGRWGP